MTPLRQRMLDDLQLRGFSPRTQEAYVRAVHQLAAYFHRAPDELGEDELRECFLYLTAARDRHVPVAPSLPMDVQQSAGAIHVGDLEVGALLQAQAADD